jgi:hypothetical protein
LAKNQVYHARTKHIDVRFHKIRELIATSELLLEKIYTFENAADILMKHVTADKFKHYLDLQMSPGARKEMRQHPQPISFKLRSNTCLS